MEIRAAMSHHVARQRSRRGVFEQLEYRRVLTLDTFAITEFMAANSSTLADEDGEFSDWIEIHNTTDQPQSLQGWALTDDPTDPLRWRFPDVRMEPGEYRVIFASGKNRAIALEPLHTDFRLSAAGEYLALADPLGTIVQSFDDAFPAQISDQSYGLPVAQTPLVTAVSPNLWHVATDADASLMSMWPTTGFDATAWRAGVGGLGYETRQGFANFGFETADLSDWSALGVVRVATARDGVTPTQGSYQAMISATEDAAGRFNLETFLGLARNDLNSVGKVVATLGSGIKRTVHVEANSELAFDWNFLTDEPTVGGSDDFAFLTVSPGNHVIRLSGVEDATQESNSDFDRETGYTTYRYQFTEAGDYIIGLGVTNESNRFLDSGLVVDNLTIDGKGSLEDTFDSLIQTSVESDFHTHEGTLWARYEFSIEEFSTQRFLLLATQFDDGYVAYLNGQRVASTNAPFTLNWDSTAFADRADSAAFLPETVVLPLERLQLGKNVLVVSALNTGVADENLLLRAELTGLGDLFESPVFFPQATPGAPNVSSSRQFADAVQFSVERGYYDEAFPLRLTTPTVGAVIRYTLDGSVPTSSNGQTYTGPIEINGSQTVRAVAVKQGLTDSRPTTQSYLFPTDVIRQSRTSAIAKGFPSDWGNQIVTDYDMDRRIIGQNGTDQFSGRYANSARENLLSIPTLSLVMDLDDLFGGSDGIYSNPADRGIESERPTSVELIDPSGASSSFQIDAGIRVQGGISRYISSKLSFRLLFKDDYGASKLEYPLFGPDGPTTFDSISLRSSSGEHLIGIHYIRDEYARRLQWRSGNVSSMGTFMHLYINGMYWGLYNPVERIDGQFATNHYGGSKENYDVLNAGDLGAEGVSAVAGSLDAWNQTIDLARQVETSVNQADKTAAYLRLQGLNRDGSRNPAWPVYLDANNYIDYLITQIYVQNSDWPIRNYYMLRDRGPDSSGFKFFVWDAEFTLDQGRTTTLSAITRDGPGVLYQMLDSSEAFRVAFSDRVQEQFSVGGPYYVNPDNPRWDPDHPENNVPASLYAELADQVAPPLGLEAARWGDEEARNGRLFVPHIEWQSVVDANLNEFFPTRSRNFLIDVRRLGFYREAPRLSVTPGLVAPGSELQISAAAGVVYYTLDGSDPRLPDGGVSPTAIVFVDPIAIGGRTTVRTRSLSGNSWSAMNVGTYVTDALPATADDLRISEVNYNPHEPLVQFGEADLNNDEFEFIEIVNRSDHAVNLVGTQLAVVQGQGVTFVFGEQILAANKYVIVPANRTAFISRYGENVNLAVGDSDDMNLWVYAGGLSNSGERITLVTNTGQMADRVSYADSAAWPRRADGGASSLERIDVNLSGDVAANFRASVGIGGSPGRPAVPSIETVRFNEVLSNPLPDGRDQIEIVNRANSVTSIGGWYVTDKLSSLTRDRLPNDSVLSAGGYLVIDDSEVSFGLDASKGDSLYLVASEPTGRPSYFADEIHFDAMAPGVSYGRWPDASGTLVPQIETSFGAPNRGPVLSDILISEVDLQPQDPDGGGVLTEEDFEFVELYNRTVAGIDVSGWQIAGSVAVVFPVGTVVPANGTLLVVPFDGTNQNRIVSFRLSFPSAAQALFVGPWTGSLPDAGGEVRLLRPLNAADHPSGPALTLVDLVQYSGEAPWPTDTHATGRSLQRRAPTAFDNRPATWTSATTSPGQVAFQPTSDGDLNGDGAIDVADVDLLCAAVLKQQFESRLDLNGDEHLDRSDYWFLIENVLQTRPGDADLNGVFNSADLVKLFMAAEYEDDLAHNSTWAEGDWNCDGDFTSSDFVIAFLYGGYTAAGSNEPAAARASSIGVISRSSPNTIQRSGVDSVLAAAAYRGRFRRDKDDVLNADRA